MTFRLPACLSATDDGQAVDYLRRYYGPEFTAADSYTGAAFDSWDSTGTRARDLDRFTADDLVAVTFLSVDVPPRAAYRLLEADAARFTALLRKVGPDRDLVEETEPLADQWPGYQLQVALENLPGVGRVTATKLFARKRPKLRPIYDSVVGALMGTQQKHWEPTRVALRQGSGALHDRLLRLREAAGAPEAVSVLRVLDVVAWMEGKAAA